VSIAESGPLFTPVFDGRTTSVRPRVAGHLPYAHADVVYLAKRWRDRGPISSPIDKHLVVDGATRAQAFASIEEVTKWLWLASTEPDWDGGSLQFTFAGHGREADGAVVLADGDLGPEELVETLAVTARATGGRLKVDLALDSCHGGAFLLGFMEASQGLPIEGRDMVAGSMHDEMAWEDGSLGHGLFTYCWSHEGYGPAPLLTGIGMQAVQPDNSLGPSTRLTEGPLGCSLLTGGRQNPVTFLDNEWSVSGSRIAVDPFDRQHVERELVNARDRLRGYIEPISQLFPSTIPDVRSDAEMAEIINQERHALGSSEQISLLPGHPSTGPA
jgi:hypothetical protein